MVHLLRTSTIVNALIRRCHAATATDVVKRVNAAVFLQAFRDRLVLGELIHEHLLVGLLRGEHI